MTTVMVQGTTSDAGKSTLVTALCRWVRRQDVSVVPFKPQNMALNSAVTADGGEIGRAQAVQAQAAGLEPHTDMNPVLLKPNSDTGAQVIIHGRAVTTMNAVAYHDYKAIAMQAVLASHARLSAAYPVVMVEGAGSPAEINLMASDIVNLRVARHADARCLLVTDIDRGGAFAHLYGTWALMPESDRALLRGFVLNKFRGDASLLAPAPEQLQALTGIATVATLPMWWQHGLPEEDGVFDDRSYASGAVTRTVAVVAYPRISNLDEFQPLKNVPGVRLVWARTPSDVAGADWIVLPGSKHTSGDLAWLRAQGLDRAIAAHAAAGGAVLGVCGGLQMLGEALVDPHGIDGNAPGLGLLPLVTVFEREKTVRHRSASFGELSGAWASLSNVPVAGYEIHHGHTAIHPQMAQDGHAVMPEGLAWQNARGNVLGLYLHGLFEDAAALHALFGAAAPTLDATFDGLADFIDTHFEPGVLQGLIA